MGLEPESLGEIPPVNDDLLVADLAAAALTPDRDDRGRQELLGGRDGWQADGPLDTPLQLRHVPLTGREVHGVSRLPVEVGFGTELTFELVEQKSEEAQLVPGPRHVSPPNGP